MHNDHALLKAWNLKCMCIRVKESGDTDMFLVAGIGYLSDWPRNQYDWHHTVSYILNNRGEDVFVFRQIARMKGGPLVNDQYLMMKDFSRNLLAGQLA
jgi:hypothetical protein